MGPLLTLGATPYYLGHGLGSLQRRLVIVLKVRGPAKAEGAAGVCVLILARPRRAVRMMMLPPPLVPTIKSTPHLISGRSRRTMSLLSLVSAAMKLS